MRGKSQRIICFFILEKIPITLQWRISTWIGTQTTKWNILGKSEFFTFCQTNLDLGNPDKIAYALCLSNVGISAGNHSKEIFHWFRKWQKIRCKTEVDFSIMKSSWKLLHHVVEYYSHPGDDQLIQIGEDALRNKSKWSDLCFSYNFAKFGEIYGYSS